MERFWADGVPFVRFGYGVSCTACPSRVDHYLMDPHQNKYLDPLLSSTAPCALIASSLAPTTSPPSMHVTKTSPDPQHADFAANGGQESSGIPHFVLTTSVLLIHWL